MEVPRPSAKRGPKAGAKKTSSNAGAPRKSTSVARGGSEDAQHVLDHFHNATMRGVPECANLHCHEVSCLNPLKSCAVTSLDK